MPTEWLIVRHGESEGNRDGVFTGHGPSPLTDRGRRQAEAVGRALAALAPVALYTSDLPRAVATAAPLAALTGLDPVLTPRLRERCMGDYTGMAFTEVQARHPTGWAALVARDPAFRPPAGESHLDCRARVAAFLRETRAAGSDGRVVLVSHGVAIHHMLRHLLGIDGAAAPAVYFAVDNCSIHRLEQHDDGAVRVAALNATGHLADL